MDDADRAAGLGPDAASSRLAGAQLREAREAKGLSLAEVAARTRIPLRHLEAIERSSHLDLPSPTYAVGFARAYARAVGVDEVAIAREVRADAASTGRRQPEYQPYAVADPSRVPPRALAIAGVGVAVALVVLATLWFGGDWLRGRETGSPGAASAVVAAVPQVPAATQAVPPVGGQVTLAATDEVWLRVYDADDRTLYLGTMKPGERFDVPGDARDPQINVGRPDKLQVSLNGSAVPPLGTGERAIKDVRVSAAAIAERLRGPAAPRPPAS